MAAVVAGLDRRRERRCTAGSVSCQPAAVLRPGQVVVLVNISSRAALIESEVRLRPGAHTELQLAMRGGRRHIRGRLDRCHVSALEPLRYRGVLVFDDRFAFDE